MDSIKKKTGVFAAVVVMLTALTACSLNFGLFEAGYRFNGSNIDYTKTKTIQIAEFPNRAPFVWAPMAGIFNDELKDKFARQTKLQQVRRNGDLVIEGEITQYQQRNKAVSAEGSSSMVELTMTVNVRFTNKAKHEEDFESQFSASRSYDSRQSLNSVQEELVNQMTEDLVDQIFNATVATW